MQKFQALIDQIDQAATPDAVAQVVVSYYDSEGIKAGIKLNSGETLGDVLHISSTDTDEYLKHVTPLHSASGSVFGNIYLEQSHEAAYLIARLAADRLEVLQHTADKADQDENRLPELNAVIGKIAQMILANLEMPTLLEQVAALIHSELKVESVEILAVHEQGILQDAKVSSLARTDASDSALQTGSSNHNSRTKSKLYHQVIQQRRPVNEQGMLLLPILGDDQNTVLGLLVLSSSVKNTFTANPSAGLQQMADQLGIAIQQSRVLGELRARMQEMAALTEISLLVNATLDIQELASRVYYAVASVQNLSLFRFEHSKLKQ